MFLPDAQIIEDKEYLDQHFIRLYTTEMYHFCCMRDRVYLLRVNTK